MPTAIRLDIGDLVFDPRSRRWRYKDSRQFASMQAVKAQADKYRVNQQRELILLGKEYTNGTLALKDFQRLAADKLKAIHVASVVSALDKQSDMSPEKLLIAARNLKVQYYAGRDYLTNERFGLKYLFTEIEAGTVSPVRMANRLSLFGMSGKHTYWQVKQSIAKSNNFTQVRRILGKAEHCANCIEYARRGWGRLENVILPTQACQCRTNCKCSLEFR